MSDITNESVLAHFFAYHQLSHDEFYDKALFPGLNVEARHQKLLEVLKDLEDDWMIIRQDASDAGLTWKISDKGFATYQSTQKPAPTNTITGKKLSKSLVTPTQKDQILLYLVQNANLEEMADGPVATVLADLEMSFEVFNAIMNQFQRLGFIEELNLTHSHVFFILLLEAQDFYNRGGFVAQEEILKTNLEKLMYELQKLQKDLSPDYTDKANKIAGIVSAIASVIPFFTPKS